MQTHQSGLRLFDLRANTCRWPLGGTWEPAEFFCGERTLTGCPYCKGHQQRAFTATKNLIRKQVRP